jgi:negative regulator of flagellin synthesis FlgM
MRIDLNSISLNNIEREDKAKKAAGKQSGAANIEDKATLSSDSLDTSALEAQALASPEVRQDKVEALRQQVQNGQYKVDADEIAKSILKYNK